MSIIKATNSRIISAQIGFTLLELLIVLVILGFTSTLVTPNLWRSHEKSQQRNTLQQFATALDQYRIEAYKAGRTIELTQENSGHDNDALKPLPNLPTDWHIESATTLRFLPTGVTNGAKYKIKSPNREWLLTITPLDGLHKIELL